MGFFTSFLRPGGQVKLLDPQGDPISEKSFRVLHQTYLSSRVDEPETTPTSTEGTWRIDAETAREKHGDFVSLLEGRPKKFIS